MSLSVSDQFSRFKHISQFKFSLNDPGPEDNPVRRPLFFQPRVWTGQLAPPVGRLVAMHSTQHSVASRTLQQRVTHHLVDLVVLFYNLNTFYDWLLPVCSVAVFIRLSSNVKKQSLVSPVVSSIPTSQLNTVMGFPAFRWIWMLSYINTQPESTQRCCF